MNDVKSKPSAGDYLTEKQHIIDVFGDTIPNYIGDAIEIGKFDQQKLKAKLQKPYVENIDEFEGKFLLLNETERFDKWTESFTQDIKDYISQFIEDESREGIPERAKVGLFSFNSDKENSFLIQPINHLITTVFNRKLASERIQSNTESNAHQLWAKTLVDSASPTFKSLHFTCPSQLFVEIALITSDGFVPTSKKSGRTSVYARRNNMQPLRTCGIESGLDWKKVITNTKDDNIVELDLLSGIFTGLKREYPMPDWEDRKSEIKLELKSLALQLLHLNTSIVGYCTIPYTKAEIDEVLRGQVVGGLDHYELDFIPVDECQNMLKEYAQSTGWHGTAMMRLQLISNDL